uniref:Uncharacterized protein n=1 Tax=Peronospora matthiolae TaxID=2874970 RepID=A0AAV1UJT4_9STRA
MVAATATTQSTSRAYAGSRATDVVGLSAIRRRVTHCRHVIAVPLLAGQAKERLSSNWSIIVGRRVSRFCDDALDIAAIEHHV